MRVVILLTTAAALLACGALALQAQQHAPVRVRAEAPAAFNMPVPGPGIAFAGQEATFRFVAAQGAFGENLVTNAPFSAEAVTETSQTLADGTRINRKTTSALYRDSQGRTRRETTLNAIGPWPATGDAPKMVIIVDPVEKVTYVLDAQKKEAYRTRMPDPASSAGTVPHMQGGGAPGGAVVKHREVISHSGGTAAGTTIQHSATAEAQGGGGPVRKEVDVRVIQHEGPPVEMVQNVIKIRHASNFKREPLGTQTIEGLVADGSRITDTIAAGEIGNDRPITTVSERWYSPELKTLVMSKTADPQFGETIYRLTNVSRAEPPRSLFQVPADYTVKENAGAREGLVIRHEEGKRQENQK